MNRNIRSLMVFAFDLLAMIVAWVGGYLLRFNFVWPHQYTDLILSGGAILLPLHAIICRWAGLYLGMWVFASLPDLRRVLKAVAASTLMLGVVMLLYRPTALLIPRSLLVLYPLQVEVKSLGQAIDDAVLVSGDEAYREALNLYAVAKPVAEVRFEVEKVVKTLRAMFMSVRATQESEGGENI